MTSLPSLQVVKLSDLSMNDKMILVQYGIEKYENEDELLQKLSGILPEKDIQRSLDTLIGTQRVRRIGPDVIQNNTSHTPLPELPENLKPLVEQITKIWGGNLIRVFKDVQAISEKMKSNYGA